MDKKKLSYIRGPVFVVPGLGLGIIPVFLLVVSQAAGRAAESRGQEAYDCPKSMDVIHGQIHG